ncbi:unnamed protein product [Tilletia laevis]|uniref:Uncharacterized protein n=1 Tax=Tilletia laevis TaxID=157183 RepID=A0A9N8QFN0_9BASI|nr:unnamed protein product [Tilletia laevis]CAD6956389.1 unnamed protein product [Tilletia caries]
MTDPSMLAKQSSVDDKIEEARSLLPPAALQSASILASASPAAAQLSPVTHAPSHGDPATSAKASPMLPSVLLLHAVPLSDKFLVLSATLCPMSVGAEKKRQVADAEEEDRPVVRPRTEQDGQAQSRTPAAVTAAVKTALTPSQSVMPTPTPAVLIPDATTTQDQRSLTTVAATSRVKTQDA